ncbi:phage tail tube protein [candidate division KSB1 bacterium]
MPLGQGYRTVMGAGVESGGYSTAAAVTATDLIPFERESFEKSFARIRSNVLRGEAGRRSDDQGGQTVAGSLPVTLMYDKKSGSNFFGADLLLALGMGSASHSTGVTTMSLADQSTDISTVAINKDVSVWQLDNGKIGRFSISGRVNEPVKAEFDMVFRDLTRGSTLANTSSTLAALEAAFGDPAYIRHRDLTFRIGDLSDALSTGDVVRIEEWTLNVNNNLVSDDYGSGSQYALEPVRDGFREVTFSATIPRYQNDNFIDWFNNDSTLQADLTYTSSTNWFIVELHTLKITDFGAPMEGPGTVRQRVEMAAFIKSTDNSYMTGSNEFIIKTKNERTASPLA